MDLDHENESVAVIGSDEIPVVSVNSSVTETAFARAGVQVGVSHKTVSDALIGAALYWVTEVSQ